MDKMEKLLNDVVIKLDKMSSPYVSGDIGIANYLTYKSVTDEIREIREHLTPIYISERKVLYRKEEIDNVIQNM